LNNFENQMFNPTYFNESYYRQMQAQQYNADQNERVLKVVHSFSDMLEQVDGMDAEHQQQAFLTCLTIMAQRNGWR